MDMRPPLSRNWQYINQDLSGLVDPRLVITKHMSWAQPLGKDSTWNGVEPDNYNLAIYDTKPHDFVFMQHQCFYRLDRSSGTDATITWNESTDKWNISNSVTVDSDLTASSLTSNTIKSSTATAITLSGDDVTIVGDLAVNGGNITTTQTTANVFNTNALTVNAFGNATTINTGNSATANNFNGFITLNSITSRFADTTTTTATTQFALTTTTRNAMKAIVNIQKGTDVHIVEVLVVAVDATTALITIYGELFNTAKLADFDADVSSGSLRLLVTPTSATSTVFNYVRDSLN